MPQFARTRALILSRPAVIAALGVAFALVLGAVLLTALATRRILSAEDRAAHAQQSLAAATDFLATLSDAGLAARDAVVAGDAAARAEYHDLRERHGTDLAQLRRQFDGAAGLSPVFAVLQHLTRNHFEIIDQMLLALPASGPSAWQGEIVGRSSREIRRVLAALQRQQFTARGSQSAEAANYAAMIRELNMGLLLVAAALAIAGAWWLRRSRRDLDGLITVCAWTRRVQWEGRWMSFEEYLAARFDLRCTHGICEEAAEKVRQQVAAMPRMEQTGDGRRR